MPIADLRDAVMVSTSLPARNVRALLSTSDERAYQNGNAMVRPQDAYLPSDSSYPTSHARDNSAKKGLLNVVTAVIFTTTPKSNYRVSRGISLPQRDI